MDIAAWLRELGLERYEPAFRESEIDAEVLPDLTESDLSALGLPIGPRRKLLKAIAALREGNEPSSPAGQPSAVPAPVSATAPEAERRSLTVWFCDLVGSTALSARLDPEDYRAVIGAYHGCAAAVIERTGGFVAKYMGDGVLAYFGYPRADEHDAERAVRAGLALVEAVAGIETAAGEPLQVRIGIATGLVVVGDLIGQGAAQEQAVVGETPNLAARLQALAEPGTVVIAPSTRRLTGGLFDYQDLGAIEIKGLAIPVEAARVVRESGAESRFEALRAARTPLVGRDEELALLQRRWQQAKTGEGCIVLISGEPGIGKSRLAQTLLEWIAGEPHTRLRTFCSPHHQDHALYPTITQLERAAGYRREDTVDQRLDKLEAVLAQATNDLGETAPVLAALLSLPTGERYPPLNRTPQKQKEKTLQALVAQVSGLAARQPLLMLFEDAHWSDPTSLELYDLIIDRVPALRALLIVTYRPEFSPPWIGRPHVTSLGLNRLAPRQRAEMITGVTGGKALPRELADQIAYRTDGVPLFVEELTKAVVESGMLTDAGDRYTAVGPVPALAIPASLEASLLARLDRLSPVREVAQIGATLGRQFSHELIAAVAPMPQKQLDDGLAELVGAELVFRRGTPPDAEYTFKHALVQDAAYSTLLRGRRQQLHARIAETLQRQFPEIVARDPALLAQHCAEAGFNEKAVGYRITAGQQALARSAMTEAVAQLTKGLEVLANLPEGPARQQHELDLRLALGPALIATQGWAAEATGKIYERAGELCEELDQRQHLGAVLFGQFTYRNVRGEYRLAHETAAALLRIGEARNDALLISLGHHLLGYNYIGLGEFTLARAELEQTLRAEDADPALRSAANAMTEHVCDEFVALLSHLAVPLAQLGYLDQARARQDAAIQEARRLAHAFTLAFALGWSLHIEEAASEAVMLRAEELLALTSEHGFPFWKAWGTLHRGRCLAMVGRETEGIAQMTEGLAAFRSTGTVAWLPLSLIRLAEAYGKARRPLEGLEHLTEAIRIIERTEEREFEAELYRVRGELLLATEDAGQAEESFCTALEIARRQSAKLWELRAATNLAWLWRDQGRRAEARDLLASVCGWFTESFDTPVLQEARALLDELSADPES
jgi:class 3 adenylate cyclase/predicted ATPase